MKRGDGRRPLMTRSPRLGRPPAAPPTQRGSGRAPARDPVRECTARALRPALCGLSLGNGPSWAVPPEDVSEDPADEPDVLLY